MARHKNSKTTHETMTRNSSSRGWWWTAFLWYLGLRRSWRVFGLWKETEVRFLDAAVALVPWRAAFFAALAFVVVLAFFELFVGAIADDEEDGDNGGDGWAKLGA